jgi:plasmid stability protein
MVKIHIDIPKELKKELKVLAATNNTSMNALVGDFIERCLLEIRKEAA